MKTVLYVPNLKIPSFYLNKSFNVSDSPLIPVTFNLGNCHYVFYLKDIPSILEMQTWDNPLLQSHNELSTIVKGYYFLCSDFWMQDYIFEKMEDCIRIWRISDFSYIDYLSLKEIEILGGKDFGDVQVFILYDEQSEIGKHWLLVLYGNKRIVIPTGCINDNWEFNSIIKTSYGFICKFHHTYLDKYKSMCISFNGKIFNHHITNIFKFNTRLTNLGGYRHKSGNNKSHPLPLSDSPLILENNAATILTAQLDKN